MAVAPPAKSEGPKKSLSELGLDNKSSESLRLKEAMAPATKPLNGPGKAPAQDVVCDVHTRMVKQGPKDVKFASLQTVGARNDAASVNGLDYVAVGNAAFPVDGKIDVADSVKKLVPYELVRATREGSSTTLLISIPGMSETRGRPAVNVAPKPGKTLRILVVGGAAELAVSGLDLIDNSLNAAGSDRIDLDIEWQLVDQAGSTRTAGQYQSFGALVKAAADKGLSRPDVLDEAQLLELFDDFETLMRSRKVEKVFWVKGAYSIPSTIPQRLEKFLDTVSASDAIPHTPSGQPSKWLQIVTARMPGFSIAYLKEPVNSRQSGEVLEEGPGSVTATRRLVSAEEANLLALKLRTTLSLSAATPRAATDTPPDRGGLSGKLVLDAQDVFDERGYVLSAESAVALQNHLKNVQNLWAPDGAMRSKIIADFAGTTGRPQPSILDVLQMGDSKTYPRLPKTLPDWSLKSLAELKGDEKEKARAFVSTYADGVARLVDETRRPVAPSGPNCTLFYVSEVGLGFK
ncbi:hypothetical protein PMI42_03471 [Bradyrhizobium sp. YR681]|nr:hypothetical protein PMI42_03471 [Bradyrhizobium sp. YR681]